MNDPIMAPAHYTIYPVQPIEITRYLGFCMGNVTKYVLRAPYKGGVADCLKALRYLEFEKELPQPLLGVAIYKLCAHSIKTLLNFFYDSHGDALWEDIAIHSAGYLENLRLYLVAWSELGFTNMRASIYELKRVLTLRDTTAQIYEGMSGIPIKFIN